MSDKPVFFQRRCDRPRDWDTYYGHCADMKRKWVNFQKYACFSCRKVFKCTSEKPDADWDEVLQRAYQPPHCPGCGQEGRDVGTAFMAPPKDDVRHWKELQEWIENGGREKARESFEQEQRDNERRWDDSTNYLRSRVEFERKNRSEVLRKAVDLGVRTSEEERKLDIIRGMKGKEKEESWGVVIAPQEPESKDGLYKAYPKRNTNT